MGGTLIGALEKSCQEAEDQIKDLSSQTDTAELGSREQLEEKRNSSADSRGEKSVKDK